MQFLSKEEQFKEYLNNEEIEKIEDYELRNIRQKHWREFHNAFIDEHGIPDIELERVTDEIHNKELQEIKKYREKYNV